MDILKILFEPNKFFSEENERESGIKMPFLIVLLNGILLMATTFLVMDVTLPAMGLEGMLPADTITFMILFSSMVSLIMIFVIWLILTGVFYLISCFFDSEGGFKKTFKFVGYGFLPMIFASIISFISTFAMLPAMKNAIQMARGDPVLMETLMMEAMQGDPIVILSSVIGIVFTVWSVYIWIFAIRYARGVSLKNSMIIVGVPSAIYVIYSMYSLIGII